MDSRNMENFGVLLEVKLKLEQLIEKSYQFYQEELDNYNCFTYKLKIFEQKYFSSLEYDHADSFEDQENSSVEDESKQNIVTHLSNSSDLQSEYVHEVDCLENPIDWKCDISRPVNFPHRKISQRRSRNNDQLCSMFQKRGSRDARTDNFSLCWKSVLFNKSIQNFVNRFSTFISLGKKEKDKRVWSRKKWSSYLLLNGLVGRCVYFNDLPLSLFSEFHCEYLMGIWLVRRRLIDLKYADPLNPNSQINQTFIKIGPSLPRYNGHPIKRGYSPYKILGRTIARILMF
jgi:hypothetical protein